jgi:ApaG protein
MNTSEATTRGVKVEVESRYLQEKSDPGHKRWFFAYDIRISNEGDDVVQLLTRHWIITDANGNVEEVKGPGVVGNQPVLAPGESFEYTTLCTQKTPTRNWRDELISRAAGGSSEPSRSRQRQKEALSKRPETRASRSTGWSMPLMWIEN